MIVPPNETFLKTETIAKLRAALDEKETFVARGAFMYCTMGTHEERLNRPASKGVFVNRNELMTVADSQVSSSEHIEGQIVYDEPGTEMDGNIYSFGFCRSEDHPQKDAEMNPDRYHPPIVDGSYIFDVDPNTLTQISGKKIFPCVPKLVAVPSIMQATPLPTPESLLSIINLIQPQLALAPQWEPGHPKVTIEGVPALTTNSCLQCKWGGTIRFLTNGMEEMPDDLKWGDLNY